MNPYLLWLIYFPLQLAVSIFCKLTAPLACIFVVKRIRTDRVKIYGNEELTFDREYLWGPFSLWHSHDNACDEYFFGDFSRYSIFPFIRNCTREKYASSWFIRYFYRLLWVYRNTAYGFAYHVFGRDTKTQTWFQIKKDVPLVFGYYNSLNVGWKTHRSAPDPDRAMYAGRVLGLRKK
jgi:hypothetical protein